MPRIAAWTGKAAWLLAAERAVVAVRSHGARNEMVGNVFEVELQFGLEPTELCPHHAVEGPFAGPHHDGRAPLSLVAEGTQTVLATDGDEQPDRPHVGQRELEFALRSAVPFGIGETAAQPLRCRPRSGPFAWTARLSEQGLHLGEFFPELFVTCHRKPDRRPKETAAMTQVPDEAVHAPGGRDRELRGYRAAGRNRLLRFAMEQLTKTGAHG